MRQQASLRNASWISAFVPSGCAGVGTHGVRRRCARPPAGRYPARCHGVCRDGRWPTRCRVQLSEQGLVQRLPDTGSSALAPERVNDTGDAADAVVGTACPVWESPGLELGEGALAGGRGRDRTTGTDPVGEFGSGCGGQEPGGAGGAGAGVRGAGQPGVSTDAVDRGCGEHMLQTCLVRFP